MSLRSTRFRTRFDPGTGVSPDVEDIVIERQAEPVASPETRDLRERVAGMCWFGFAVFLPAAGFLVGLALGFACLAVVALALAVALES